MSQESRNIFGRIEEEMSEEVHPMYQKLRAHIKKILIALGAVVLVAALATGYWYYKDYTLKTAKQRFERIVQSNQGKARIEKLEELLDKAPWELQNALLLDLGKRCMKQGMYQKAAQNWKRLAGSQSDSNIGVIAKLGRAKALRLQGDNQKAMQILEKLSQNAPKPFRKNINFELAVVAEKVNHWQTALSAYQSLLSNSRFVEKRQQYIHYKISRIKQKVNQDPEDKNFPY